MRMFSKKKGLRPASSKVASAALATVEAVESRVLMSATLNHQVFGPADTATGIEFTGSFGSFLAVQQGTGTGSRAFSEFGFLQLPISDFSPNYTVDTSGSGGVNSLSLTLNNTATTGAFAPTAGTFDVYVLPDNATAGGGPAQITAGNLFFGTGTGVSGRVKGSTGSGLASIGSNFGTQDAASLGLTSANLAGTFSITSSLPAGNSTFTLSSLPSAVQAIIANDFNTYNAGNGLTNTPISIAIVADPSTPTASADWEGNFTNPSQNPFVQLDLNEVPANTTESYSIGATAAADGVTVNETAGQAVIDVTRSGFNQDATTLNYQTTAGTAVDGTNYTGTQTGTVSFVAGQTTAEISIPVTNANFSGTKTFSVTLTSDSPTQSNDTATIGASSANVTIVGSASLTNNAGPVLASSATVIEASGPFTGTSFIPVSGSAFNGSFGFLSYAVIQATPAPGSTLADIQNLSLSLDNTATTGNFGGHAGDFNMYFLPTTGTSASPATTALKFNSTVDGVQGTANAILLGTFSFQNSSGYDTYTAATLSAAAKSAILNDLNSGTQSIRLAVAPGSANFAADWEGIFGTGTPTVSLTGTITNSTETYNIGAAAAANGVTVNENNANNAVLVDVARSGYLGDATTVSYKTTAGTAVDGTNYTGTQSGMISFASGQSQAEISIPTTNAGFSGTKNFTVTLTGVTSSPSATSSLGAAVTSSVTMVGTASLTNNVSKVPASSVTDIETSGTFVTSFAPVNGSIYSGTGAFGFLAYEVVELTPASTPNVFPAPGSVVNSLSNLSLSLYNTATTGNFGGHIGNFNIYFLANTEATKATSALKFSTATVDGVNGAAGAALLGTFSFDNNTGYDTFTPATLSPTVSSAIVADLNSGTAFRLAVAPGSTAFAADWSGFFAGQTPTISLTDSITVNQTPETIAFQSATYSQSETGPTATITLTRSGPNISDTATVHYATADGSALAGTNYTASAGTATFVAGSATATFTIPVSNVPYPGGDKFLTLALSAPGTGSPSTTIGVLGTQTTATLTITDSSTAPTETLDPTLADASDIEANGPFDDTEIKATAVSSKFPSYGVVDFTPTTPTATITGIDSATLTVTNKAAGSIAGAVDFYLVSDSTSNVSVGSPQSRNPHFYDSTAGIEGIGTQFGTKYLLGSYTLKDVAGGDTFNIPLSLTSAGEAALVAALNNTASNFRIVMTPEDTTVAADFVSTTVALSVKVQEGSGASAIPLDTINGGAGVNQIVLARDADGQHIDWTLNSNPQVYSLLINDPNGLTINGGGSNDVITLINTPNGNPLPNLLKLNGRFTINGLQGTNPLAGTTVDIGTSTVFIPYGSPGADPITLIKGYLQNGYNGNTWTGTATPTTGAIRSSGAAVNPNAFSIGYADSADVGNPANIAAANTIELRYAGVGDTNLNDTVDANDYAAVVRGFGTGTTWDQGVVTYDGTVSANDYAAVVRAFGTVVTAQSPTPAGAPDTASAVAAASSTAKSSDSTQSTAANENSSPQDLLGDSIDGKKKHHVVSKLKKHG